MGQGLEGQAPNGIGTCGIDTQQGRDEGTGTQWGRDLGVGVSMAPMGQDTHQGRVFAVPSLMEGTGNPLGTGCPLGWGTHWVEDTHGEGGDKTHRRDKAPPGHGTHGGRTPLRDRGHPRGCSQVPPLPIGARRGRGCARWTKRTATSARPAGSRSACKPA